MTSSNATMPCVLCESALNITAQATVHHLQLEIKRILEALPFVHSFHGFEVRENANKQDTAYSMSDYADLEEVKNIASANHPLAGAALGSHETQFLEQEQSWLCFVPVKYGDARNLWLVECVKSDDKPNLKHVWLLVNVYQNCASHISLQNTDPLTGLENRQALSERLGRVLKGNRRSNDSSTHQLPSICLLDIDFFKRVNDDFGHLYGDEVLLLFSGLMKQTFRENDFLYRYGGEEFVVLLDSSTDKESVIALERFRSAVEAYVFPQVGHITVSIGFVAMQMGELPSSTIDKADKALYFSKENGRNQLNCYDDLLSKQLIENEKTVVDSELF